MSNSCCLYAGQEKGCDRCFEAMCDDIVRVFTAGWCPGMSHSAGHTNQASPRVFVSRRCVLARLGSHSVTAGKAAPAVSK